MRVPHTIQRVILASSVTLVCFTANAQGVNNDDVAARRADHSADVRRIQADRDQHAADVSKLEGNNREVKMYSHAAAIREGEAKRDARLSRHEIEAAERKAKHGN